MQDIVWGTVCIFCLAALIAGFVRLAIEVSLMSVLWLTILGFVAWEAWRRTKWGAPPDGPRARLEQRAARNE